jgi:hypothetical protein
VIRKLSFLAYLVGFADGFQAIKVLPGLYFDHLAVKGNWDGSTGSRFIFD